jgi:septal ring factor EnvC (AmiA/AmiB activator)
MQAHQVYLNNMIATTANATSTDVLLYAVLASIMVAMILLCAAYRSLCAQVDCMFKKLNNRIDEYDNNVAGVEEKLLEYQRDNASIQRQLEQITNSINVVHDRALVWKKSC